MSTRHTKLGETQQATHVSTELHPCICMTLLGRPEQTFQRQLRIRHNHVVLSAMSVQVRKKEERLAVSTFGTFGQIRKPFCRVLWSVLAAIRAFHDRFARCLPCPNVHC